jgi:DNA mismatch endonuclease (patch repair protein)
MPAPTEAAGSPIRRHRGDIMTPEKRSAVMARIRGRDTGPELAIAERLRAAGAVFETHARDLPGRPDIVFRGSMIVVLIDGDFWHGWRFPLWRDKLSTAWEVKIEGNRRRDLRNMRKLRRRGWQVIRIWEHQIERDLGACVRRVMCALSIQVRPVP